MLARISTILKCSEDILKEKLADSASLRYVAAPLLSFQLQDKEAFHGKWEQGKTYALNLYFFKVIPLGHHNIYIKYIDEEANVIVSQESGLLAPVWNHTIRLQILDSEHVHYTDEIEIEAGWRTPIIWCFAHIFYRYRQYRWKKLLKSLRSQ